MDANQTGFCLVLGDDWHAVREGVLAPGDPSASVAVAGGLLTLAPKVEVVRLAASDLPADPALRLGAVRDRLGNTYTVDGAGIRLRTCNRESVESWFWFPGDPAAPTGTEPRLRGLAITSDELLVAGRGREVLVFNLVAGGAPASFGGPAGLSITDLSAVGPDAWVLDGPSRALRRLRIQLSSAAQLRTLRGDFTPCEPPVAEGLALDLGPIVPIAASTDPVALTTLSDGDAFILVPTPDRSLLRFRVDTEVASFDLSSVSPDAVVIGHDLVARGEQVWVVDAQGNQAWVFDTSGNQPTFVAEFVPLRGYRGRDLVADTHDVWYASGGRWVPLVAMRRPRYAQSASIRLPVRADGGGGSEEGWDGGAPGLVWHRLMLDACVPSGARIRVSSRAADTRADLVLAPWHDEPPLLLRVNGTELPYAHRPGHAATETWELLLQAAVGRFLQLRLEIESDLRTTPRLASLRVYRPRFSYLQNYLPAAFREDRHSADFLDRFLANPEGIFTGIEDRVAHAQLLFRPEILDPEYLPWLASWFGATLDPGWDEARRRFFLGHAMWFFAWRGTIRGISAAVRLVVEPCPSEAIFEEGSQTLRIMEGHLRRPRVGHPPAEHIVPRAVDATTRWVPAMGLDALDQRYATFIMEARAATRAAQDGGGEGTPATETAPTVGPFPPAPPGEQVDLWNEFCQTQLGFVPGATGGDAVRFRAFLARRYGSVSAAADVWPVPEAVVDASNPLFDDLRDGPVQDWYDFESLVRPIATWAHRFTVILPTPDTRTLLADPAHAERLRSAVRRVVELERPAHTTFQVVFADYWFRPGEVRLGHDTLLGEPARDSPSLILDNGVLGSASLAAPFPVLPSRSGDRFDDPIPLVEPS